VEDVPGARGVFVADVGLRDLADAEEELRKPERSSRIRSALTRVACGDRNADSSCVVAIGS
jgi:hypothetical protein